MATRKINIEIDRSALAAQVREASSRAREEFSKAGLGTAFMAGAISSSKKEFSALTSAARQFRVNVVVATAEGEKGFKGMRAHAYEAFKTVGEFGGALSGVVEGAHTIRHLAGNWTAVKRQIDSATKSVKSFVSANRGKLLLAGGIAGGGFVGFKGAQAALRSLRADARAVTGAFRGVQERISGIRQRMSAIAFNPFTAMLIGAGAVTAAMSFIGQSIQKAADLETFSTSFEVLLGSIDKAQSRMKELVNFANTTPFELPEVAAASRELEVLTHGALSVGKGLTLVGDIAAGTNTRFEETAVTVGRLYDAIRSGRTAGESLMRLQEIGAIGGSARNQIEGLIAAGRTVDAWKLAEHELLRYTGMMERQSQTWNGLLSTFRDSVSEAMRQFAKPIMEDDKLDIIRNTDIVGKLTPQLAKLGAFLVEEMTDASNVFSAVFENPEQLAGPTVSYIKGGMKEVVNILFAGFKTASAILSGPTVDTLDKALEGVCKTLGGYLMDAFKRPVAYLYAEMEDILRRIPTKLGGSGEKEAARAGLESARTRAADEESRSIAAGGSATDAGRRHRALAEKAMKEANDLYELAYGQGPSIQQRVERMMSRNEIGNAATKNIQEGKALLAASADDLFKAIGNGIKDFKVDDVMGAQKDLDAGRGGFSALRQMGSQINEKDAVKKIKIKAAEDAAAVKPAPPSKFGDSVAGMAAFSSAAGIRTGGLIGASLPMGAQFRQSGFIGPQLPGAKSGFAPAAISDMKSATRTTSILSVRERRAIEDSRVATLAGQGIRGVRRSMTPGGFGAVRRGDRARAREAERTKLREKMDLDKTNNILERIQQRFDEMTR